MKFTRLLMLLLVAMPLVLTITQQGRIFARAEDQTDDAEEEEARVDEGDMESTEEESTQSQGSPDLDVTLLFTKPEGNGNELPAGKAVEFLMGVTNNGNREFVLDAAEASFRYPMDFNFYIQNFTVAAYNKVVKPQQEATVMYSFYPAEVFAGRPLGLQINLAYHDADGEDFIEAVFNSTVNIVEVDEGLDGETFFLYVFLLAFVVLLLLMGHTVLTGLGVTVGKKGNAKKHQNHVEIGTNTKSGVDYDWLPDQLKHDLKRAAAASTNGTKKVANGSASAVKNSSMQATRSSPRLRKA